MNYTIKPTHIRNIKTGDLIQINGIIHTVGKNDIKNGFMGLTLRGDSYKCGTILVMLVQVQVTA